MEEYDREIYSTRRRDGVDQPLLQHVPGQSSVNQRPLRKAAYISVFSVSIAYTPQTNLLYGLQGKIKRDPEE